MVDVFDTIDGALVYGVRKTQGRVFALFSIGADVWVDVTETADALVEPADAPADSPPAPPAA